MRNANKVENDPKIIFWCIFQVFTVPHINKIMLIDKINSMIK